MVAMAMVNSRQRGSPAPVHLPVPERLKLSSARWRPAAPSVLAVDLFRTKSVEKIGEDADGEGDGGAAGVGKLRKHLSARHLIAFGIGVVIGTGIFTLTGVEAKNAAGPAVVVSFVIAGVVAVLAALCYAELAASVPTAGSAYSYAYATAGELIAWIIGWDLFLEFALGAAVVARGWSGYVG